MRLGAGCIHYLHGPIDDRQRLQAEKVELDQADRLDVVFVELSHRVGATLLAVERREIRQRVRRNDDTSGMLPGVSGQPFERFGEIDDRGHFLIITIHRGEFVRLIKCLIERHPDLERHQFGDPIDEAVGMTEHPATVADHGLGRHRAEGDDLRDLVATVALG